MIRLALDGVPEAPPVTYEMTEVRITGGVIWHPLGHETIAMLTNGCWRRSQQRYPNVSISGQCYLVYGITRDPDFISEPFESLTITGPTLKARGVEFARYFAAQEIWQGLKRPMWWQVMRIIGPTARSLLIARSQVQLLNPWEPVVPGSSETTT